MKIRMVQFFLILALYFTNLAATASATSGTECQNDLEITDFHSHIFNLRHLPLKGILISRGVPKGLAAVLAKLFESATPSLADEGADERESVESRALNMPADFSPEEAATELRNEIVEMIGVDLGEMRASGESLDMCGAGGRKNVTIRKLCKKSREIDEYYRKNIEGGDLRDESTAANLDSWLRGGAVLSVEESERSGFRPAPTLDGILDQTNLDLKVMGILVEVLSDSELTADSEERGSIQDIGERIKLGLRFLRIMMLKEDEVVAALKSDYCSVQRYSAYMMDMEQVYALSKKPRKNAPSVAYTQQLKINARLVEDDHSLVYFGAHDPFRLDPNFERAEAAISSGAIGLKFYPPSGYRVSQMIIPPRPSASWCWLPFFQSKNCGRRKQWDSRYGNLSKNQYREPWASSLCPTDNPKCLNEIEDEDFFDLTNRAFVQRAVEKDWIIFSHHTPQGFEADTGYGKIFADPCYWGELLQAEPELQNLRLVIGHSGGNGWSWQCEGDSQYCPSNGSGVYESFWKHAYNLCVTFDNVYCDMGYQNAVLSEEGRASLKRNLLALAERENALNSATDQEPIDKSVGTCSYQGLAPVQKSIFNKLLYGSDWMMVSKEPGMEYLPKAFEEVFSGELEQYRKKFFTENANKLLSR